MIELAAPYVPAGDELFPSLSVIPTQIDCARPPKPTSYPLSRPQHLPRAFLTGHIQPGLFQAEHGPKRSLRELRAARLRRSIVEYDAPQQHRSRRRFRTGV